MAMDLQSSPVNEILYVTFNQDYTCFACGTETGFRVYSADPFRLTFRRDFGDDEGGVGVVSMLYCSNILAFSGGGRRPRTRPQKVVLWDDKQGRIIAELSFASPVLSVKLQKDVVVVAVERKVYVYSFRTLTLFDTIETESNPKGLCCLSVASDRISLVTPGSSTGRALVVCYPRNVGEEGASTAREKTTVIAAHDSTIAAMAMDFEGLLLATASEKGTVLRIWDMGSRSATCEKLQEVRRGLDRADIHSLAFSPNGQFMVVASDHGTIHLFSLVHGTAAGVPRPLPALGGVNLNGDAGAPPPAQPRPGRNNKSSIRKFMPGKIMPAYFASEWSLAQFRVQDLRCIAAFGSEPNSVIVVCANGRYYKARFDPTKGGAMKAEACVQLDDQCAVVAGGEDIALVEVARPCSVAGSAGAVDGGDGAARPLAVSSAFMSPDDGEELAFT